MDAFEFTPTVASSSAAPLVFTETIASAFRPTNGESFSAATILVRAEQMYEFCEAYVNTAGRIGIIPRTPDRISGFHNDYGKIQVRGFSVGWPLF